MVVTDLLPISLVAHTAFCPRRAWLESVGEEVESVAVEAGVADHARVDARADERAHRRRSVEVHDEELGIVGRCDVVDVSGGVELVEYKSAPLRRSTEVTRAQRVQLQLQALALRAQGISVDRASIYFTTSRRSVPVELDPLLEDEARRLVAQTQAIVSSGEAPPPQEADPRCRRCSHVSVCLPDERAGVEAPRRIAVAHPLASVLHLATPGSRASIRGGRLVVAQGGETLASLPMERVQSVVVHGNVDLSSALIRELLWHKRPVIWCSFRGRVVGVAHQARRPNGAARSRQGALGDDVELEVARRMIASKIANQATFLRRNAGSLPTGLRQRLRELSAKAGRADSTAALLGVEGEAASLYFTGLPSTLNANGTDFVREWPGRHGRGAADRLNVALNLVYGLLAADAIRALLAAGLDPYAGVLHSSSRNKPALALDLMEEFRPIIADSVVVGAINNGELRPEMFSQVLGDARLKDRGRRALIAAYERRVATEFTHPIFGYKIAWRRAIEVQARMILGVIDGTQDSYRGITTR